MGSLWILIWWKKRPTLADDKFKEIKYDDNKCSSLQLRFWTMGSEDFCSLQIEALLRENCHLNNLAEV